MLMTTAPSRDIVAANIANADSKERVMNRQAMSRSFTGAASCRRDIGIGDIGFGVLLSALSVTDATGLTDPSNHGGVAASLAVLLMTAPVIFARHRPLIVAAVLAAGAGLNWLLIGHQVNCATALPAVFYVAFMIGSRRVGWRPVAVGMAALVVNLLCQSYSDPRLAGPGGLVGGVPIVLGFLVAGRLLQRRNTTVAALRLRTAELHQQRERNARLAVAADQARIAGDLDGYLHDQVDGIAAAAQVGRARIGAGSEGAEAAFVAIQATGRATLARMRGVVADLRDQTPTGPQPVLAQLDRLLDEATRADTRLQVSGDTRLLPPGVELSGYRIVEHLLLALENDPAARIDVAITFTGGALELAVTGPKARHADVRPALAAAAERARLHGGTLRSQIIGGRRETVVRLPLPVGHA
jgi:signal transduction histidine kinase